MKLGIFSDLHLHPRNPYDFVPEEGVFYINAGDVSDSKITREYFLSEHKDYMFSVMGNHDYYYADFPNPSGYKQMKTYEKDGIKIVGATLWTDLSDPMNYAIYKGGLIDSIYIDNLSHQKMMDAHEMHRDFLFNSGADIIVSHHCPSILSVSGQYKNDPLNCCFYTDYTDAILNMSKPPKLWIHGHTHDEFDYMIGSTRVICHPRGYRNEKPWYKEYKPKIVEI
jgi:predicted phosphodiesterase